MLVVPTHTSTYNNSQQSDSAIHQQYYLPTNTNDLDLDIDLDLDLDSEHSSQSISSSPQSIQSFLSQYSAAEASPLSAFASVPAATIPRRGLHDSLLKPSTLGQSSMMATNELMAAEAWLPGNAQFASRPGGGSRASHHRESSLSSLGSAGPASPYSQNTSNPHIAVTDSMGEGYQNLPYYDDSSYQLAKSLSQPNHDAFYANHGGFTADPATAANYASFLASQKYRADRGLLPPPELSVGSNKSRPVSVASSVASDSPATPLLEQPEEDRRRKTVFSAVPKLDRTMTDIYSDELYSPSFAITSASPSQTSQMPVSPSHDMFAQRLQAINSQHLSVAHSPASTSPRDKSPFRQGSPLAPTPMHDFASSRYNSVQQLREQRKVEQDAQALRQQLTRSSDAGTPQTISPKDAILDFSEADGEANFPLFPQPNGPTFDGTSITKTEDQSSQVYDGLPSLEHANFNYLPAQLPNGLQLPQQYPFVAQARQASNDTSMSNHPLATPSRVSSTESNSGASLRDGKLSRPAGASADGGTYTCTYHGCTLRFETPALLQKHKREGHRQAHGLNNSTRRVDTGMTSSLLNSQAGPHRCDRINPSTGKPCSTIFSRPYDLTRHEDTIHNGRKQKVRCNMCTEEKTFSRADALTRHYRVCHPDVEFPGKHRRRGGHGN